MPDLFSEPEDTRPVVLSLCDLTGNAVRPWAEAGYRCICVDTQHKMRSTRVEDVAGGGSIEYRWGDVRSLTPGDFPRGVVFVAAWPPCTHLTKTAAQDWPRKGLRLLVDALELVEACRVLCEWYGCPWMLENPVGRLSSLWRKPDHIFNPCDFGGYLEPAGDAYTKATCLWTGGGFRMPEPRRVEPVLGSMMHYAFAPGPDRANKRSATPMGFARAVFEANRRRDPEPAAEQAA